MKNILIVIGDMKIGGAQRSLLSFLRSLSASEYGELYHISLMVVDPVGAFYSQIPESVTLVPAPKALRWLGTAFGTKLLKEQFSLGCLAKQISWLLKKKLGRFPKDYNTQQKLWTHWKEKIPALPGYYDTAISYIDGFPNYYVMDKVSAGKKVLWVHSEYGKMRYDPKFDKPYYDRADRIVTISQKCRQCILEEFPHRQDQTFVLENITDPREILEKSLAEDLVEYPADAKLKLLTVARLDPLKGLDIAVETAAHLKNAGVDFCWLAVGDGPQRERLQTMLAEYGLTESFYLLGSRNNPYTYMRCCDILVQPSRVEGKSIVLDEAKVLHKLIVTTNYTTVADSICHGETGMITEIDPKALAEGIIELWSEPALQAHLIQNLKALPAENAALLRRYTEIML